MSENPYLSPCTVHRSESPNVGPSLRNLVALAVGGLAGVGICFLLLSVLAPGRPSATTDESRSGTVNPQCRADD